MKVGWDKYAQKTEKHAHSAEKPQETERNHKKSGKQSSCITGFLQKSSILRTSL